MFDAIDINQKFQLVTEYYTPKQIASLNGTAIKIAKFKGPFTWHTHIESDEIFWVVRGTLTIMMRASQGDTGISITENQLFSVPKGVEHKPVADNEVWVVLLEPEDMINTGDVSNEFTVKKIDKI